MPCVIDARRSQQLHCDAPRHSQAVRLCTPASIPSHPTAIHPPSGSTRPALCRNASSCWKASASCRSSHSICSTLRCPSDQPLIQRLRWAEAPEPVSSSKG